MKSNQKYIYIVLSQTVSVVGKVLRKVMRNDYAHISVSFNQSLSPMYSFSRIDVENPFVGGPAQEELRDYFLGKSNAEIKMKVFCIPVTQEQIDEIGQLISKVFTDDEEYYYNILEPLNNFKAKPITCYKTFVCSTFVAEILSLTDIGKIQTKKSFISPQAIGEKINQYKIYDGEILDYEFFSANSIEKIKRNKIKVASIPIRTTSFYSKVLVRDMKSRINHHKEH